MPPRAAGARYAGSIVGAGILAGVLGGVTGDIATFRIVMLAVVATTALALISATFIHRFAIGEPTPVARGAASAEAV